jgi:site-specific recombinase XerC
VEKMQQLQSDRLFLSSIASPYTLASYKFYMKKYLETYGYNDMNELLTKDHKQIENEIIEIIIKFKEKGMKRQAISNYIRPVISFCKINDIILNSKRINKFMPPYLRSKKGSGYSAEQIKKLLDIADERIRVVILLASSCGLRIGAIPILKVGSLKEVNDLYQITVYENEQEEYIAFCTSECRKAIEDYLEMRRRYGEIITEASPLIREQFDKRDQFAVAHPRSIKEGLLAQKLTEMAEAAGLRTRIHLVEGQKPGGHTKEIPACNGFRRFYCGTLVDSGLQTEKRWLLEGHALLANDSSYVKVTPEALLEQFELAHDYLVIEPSMRLKRKVERLELERSQIESLARELQQIKKIINYSGAQV